MDKILHAVFLVLTLLAGGGAFAAEESDAAESGGAPLSPRQIEDLMIMLESDTARERFIGNLRTLAAVEAQEQGFSFSFSDAFGLDETSDRFVGSYLRLINSLGISDSTVGKVAVLLLVILAIMLLLFANNRLATYSNRKLGSVRTRFNLAEDRFQLVFEGQRIAGYLLGVLFFVSAIAFVFSTTPAIFFDQSFVTSMMEYVIVGILVYLFVIILWEAVNAAMEYGMTESSRLNSTRVKTLLPVVRNLAFFVILVLGGLVIMSELGIDIVPLLAGAGVLGIAIGFGAQTMVKDFLTGFIIVLEDLIQDGDVITVGGRTGVVERITLRKIQLRNLDGTVHTVPHSEISVVDNLTKEYSYYLMNVGVAYREDTDAVIECLQGIDEELRGSEEFGDGILEPLEILGVDEFADSAVIIKVRTKTKAHDKWRVGREFNRRLKKAFDEKGIEIPFPHRTVYFGEGAVASTEENSLAASA